MAQKIGNLAYTLARQILVKDKGGIASLPDQGQILSKVQDIFQMLKAGGYNPVSADKSIKSVNDLKKVLTDIEMKQQIEFNLSKNRSEGLETVLKKMDEGIPLNPGDQAKVEGVEKIADDEVLDAFKGFKPIIIQGGKSEGIEKLLKSGDVKKGVAPKTKTKDYKKIVELEEENMLADEARAKEFSDFSNRIKGMSSTDRVAERLKDLKNVNLSDLSGIEAQKIASEVIGRKGPFKTISNKGAKEVLGELEPIIKRADAEVDLGTKLKNFDGDPDAMAQGGIARIGMFKGGKPLRRLLQYLAGTSGKKGSQNLKDFKISDQMKFFADKQGVSADQNRIDYLEQVLESLYADKKLIQNLEPSAAKMDIENQAAQKFRKDYIDVTQGSRYEGLSSDMIDKSILELETMIKNLKTKDRKPNAIGGRIGFDKGSPPSKGRRNFLKLLGGLASIPVFGKLFKAAKPAAKATKAVEVASKTSGVPAYFPKLVEKIQMLGDDVTRTRATKEREIVKEYKGYELTEDLDTGKLTVKRDNYTSEEYLQFEPAGSYYDETRKKVIKYPDEYEEVTVKPDYEGKMKDVDYGLDNIDEIMREVDMIETDYKIAPGGKKRDKKSGGGVAYMLGE